MRELGRVRPRVHAACLVAIALFLAGSPSRAALGSLAPARAGQEAQDGQDQRPVFSAEAKPSGDPVELEAYAEFRKGGVFIADGQRVRIWAGTEMVGEEVRNPADIDLGYNFKAIGVRLPDGLIVADTVEAWPNEREFLSGSVEAAANQLENEWAQLGYVYQDEGDHRAILGEIVDFDDRVVRVERVMKNIRPAYLDPGEIRAYVVDADLWNATVFPNGSLWVNSGLIENTSEDELAIVLGHELAHYTHEHARKDTGPSWWKQALASVGANLLLGLVPGGTAQNVGQVAAAAGSRMWTMGYGAAMEAQADRVGARYAFEAGYDVYAGIEVWSRFRERYGHRTYDNESLLEAHVKPDDRIENIEREIEVNYRHELAELDDGRLRLPPR